MAGPFETQQEAVIEREKLKDEPVGYCPLARIDCISRCVCYQNARVQQQNMQWYAYEPYCDNPILIRE